jgi:hypothetical protein
MKVIRHDELDHNSARAGYPRGRTERRNGQRPDGGRATAPKGSKLALLTRLVEVHQIGAITGGIITQPLVEISNVSVVKNAQAVAARGVFVAGQVPEQLRSGSDDRGLPIAKAWTSVFH